MLSLILSIIGSSSAIFLYAGLVRGKLAPSSNFYLVGQILTTCFMLGSLVGAFNFGALIINIFWLGISLAGLTGGVKK